MVGSPNFDPPIRLTCPDHQGTHDVIPGRGSRAGDDETSQNAPWDKEEQTEIDGCLMICGICHLYAFVWSSERDF
jgi:hypothetical protein